jgi:hypothetical protein
VAVRVSWDGQEVPGPCSAGPLRRLTSVLELRDGATPWLVQLAPELTRCEAVTLERALGCDRSFEAWAALVAPFPNGSTPEPPAFRKTVKLSYAAGTGGAAEFRLVAAWPVAYEIIDGAEGPARERLTLVFEGFERLNPMPP